jgi:NAD(P)-dependent dehydrogenase (short-subunit alcohol dehydrogenase family)
VKGKRVVALVTGASSGIGLACAERLAGAGLTVYGTSRRRVRNSELGAFRMLRLDVSQDASVKACIHCVVAESGHIDVLVNNAGTAIEGAVEETSLDEIRRIFETNVFGTLRMIKAVLPIMRKRRRGRIINMGSVAGFLPMPFSAAYCASKHALHGLSESLDHEVRNLGIRVSVIEPGFVRTEIVEHSGVVAAAFEPYKTARAKPAAIFRDHIRNGVEPDVVAGAVLEAVLADVPQLSYRPGGVASIAAFLQVLPAPLFDFALRKQMHIDD